MRRMFASATLKLTAWYLMILVIISLLFSFIIFEISTSEVSRRLERLQLRAEGTTETISLPGPLTLTDIRLNQTNEARTSIFVGLLYTNLAVIGIGGVGSYLMARRTLKPIEDAHEAQSRFTSDASHELRTPLAIMKSEIQVAMRDKTMKANDYKALLESNLEEVDKLSQLSQSLLQLSRLDHGGLIERTDKVNLHDTMQQVVSSLAIDSSRMTFLLPKKPTIIDANQMTIHELFAILLDNAVKYSPSETPITISMSSNGRYIKIDITNQGDGLNKSELPRIFDRFYRGAKSRSSQFEPAGYGLGLSLARQIVHVHDGTITASTVPNKSTTFSVTLPHFSKNR